MSTFETRKAIATSKATQVTISNHLKSEEQNALGILEHVTNLVDRFLPELPAIFAKLTDMTEGRTSYKDSPWKIVYFSDVKSVERMTYHGHHDAFDVNILLHADGMAVVALELSQKWWAKNHYDDQDSDMFARLDAAELLSHKLDSLLETHNERMLRLCITTPVVDSVAILDADGIPMSDGQWDALAEERGYHAGGSSRRSSGLFGEMGGMFGGMIPMGGGILPRR